MGIDITRGSSHRAIQPKATVKRTLPNELVARTRRIFETYGEIPLPYFYTLYSDAYGELFDASALGFDDGLLGYFSQLQFVSIVITERGYMCRIRDPQSTERKLSLATRIRSNHPATNGHFKSNDNKPLTSDWLFNPDDSYLWSEARGFKAFLYMEPSKFKPAPSPLEMALERDSRIVAGEVSKIHQVMARFPDGIRLSDICTKIYINKRLFNTTSINSMVHEYPELFFVEEPREEGEDKIVYSGLTRTDADLTGSEFSESSGDIKYLDMITQFIVTGLYQKTLLTIRAAGPKGLKLASWQQSIKNNFKAAHRGETLLINLDPLYLFRGLAFSNLVQIESPAECKNDLRLKLPTHKIDFEELLRNNKLLKSKAKFQGMMAHQNSLITYKREPIEYISDGSTIGSSSSSSTPECDSQ